MISKPKISGYQLCTILVVSRLFSIFTYKPQSYEIGAVTSAICIAISMLISILLFVPTLVLMRKKSDVSVSDIGFACFGKYGKVFSFSVAVVCLFLCVDCLTQFTFFMSSTLYLSSTPIFFLLPMIAAVLFICRKGIETIARLSVMVFIGMVVAIIVISIFSISQVQTYNIEPIKYDSFSQAAMFVLDKTAHTTEIIPFLILCENVKGSLKKTATLFIMISGVLLEIVSFTTIATLGEYRKAILFPFYTISAMSQNSLSDRMSLIYIVLWVFMATIKLCVYFLSATKSINQLMQPNKKLISPVLCAIIAFVFTLFTSQNIVSIEIMYKIILSGTPIVVLAVVFPTIFLLKQKISQGGKGCD